MPTYIVLMNWTEQGVRSAKDTVDRYEGARSQFEQAGIQFRDVYWTIGPYDLVTTAEAPDEETLSASLLSLAGAGNLRTTTMRAFSSEEMRGVIEKMP
jgi:uncharacterized protein with GYD domain